MNNYRQLPFAGVSISPSGSHLSSHFHSLEQWSVKKRNYSSYYIEESGVSG